jgi:non-specific serine/threonine protein kinase
VAEYDRARALGQECLSTARRSGYGRAEARALRGLGVLSYIQQDLHAARVHLEAGIAAARELGDRWQAAQACIWLSHVEADEGHHAACASLLLDALALGQQLADPSTICERFLDGAAHVAALSGHAERALRLAGAAAAHREAEDAVLFPVVEGLVHRWLAPARTSLGKARTMSVLAQGRALTSEQAVAEACAGLAVAYPET